MKSILAWLEKSAELYADKVAFIDTEDTCTYVELRDDARRIASIVSAKVTPKNSIAVFMDKSIDAIKSFMGIVYAGCFYTLIDPSFPEDRINQMLGILETKVVITDLKNEAKIKSIVAKRNASYMMGLAIFRGTSSDAEKNDEKKVKNLIDVVNLADYYLPKYTIDESRLNSIREQISEEDVLYCNFTSGSTGVPKGVMISHKAVNAFINNFVDAVGITCDDVLGNQAPFDFDVSVKDIYSTLKCGASLVIIPRSYFMFPNKIMDLIEEHKVTTLIWAVSALVMLSRLKGLMYKAPETIDKIMFSGEVMPIKQLKEWQKYYPEAKYINLYGPTEITCNCTYHVIDREYEMDDNISIGKAFNHCKVYLLDEKGQEITKDRQGVAGEVCVAGESLAIGYCNNAEDTNKSFTYQEVKVSNDGVCDEVQKINKDIRKKERIYHTGDMAYYGEDGELYFSGRVDFQIKHMGHRIELEEIEKALGNVKDVEHVCCFFDEKKNKIVAYYVGEVSKKDIVSSMRKKVPDYMIPNVYRTIDRMPLTKNGKTDRKLLKLHYMQGDDVIKNNLN